jgi:hypothetical protein
MLISTRAEQPAAPRERLRLQLLRLWARASIAVRNQGKMHRVLHRIALWGLKESLTQTLTGLQLYNRFFGHVGGGTIHY